MLSVDGTEVATNSLEHGTPVTFPEDETFDVGMDTRTGVAMVVLPRTLAPGLHHLTVRYGGNEQVARSATQRDLRIVAVGRGGG